VNKQRPQPSQSRLLSYNLIHQVNHEGAYANIRLPGLLEDSSLDERDRAFSTELSYGTLRMQGKYDLIIARHSDREITKIDPAILDILRMGMHEIFGMRTPEHASVSQTVDLAKMIVGESSGAFVNAVLRNALRDESTHEYENDLQRLSGEYSHPEWIVQSFFDLVKDWGRVESILMSDNEPAAPHLVAWPDESTVEELLEHGGDLLQGTRFGVLSSEPPRNYLAVRERRAGVQDRGSQIIGEIFLATADGVDQDLSWLDMCAGPGGKAAYIFHSLHARRPSDDFVANEISEHRAALIAQVIPSQFVQVGSGQDLVKESKRYDRIMVDAPCTGLGALRRRPEARWRRTLQDLKELVVIQRELLDSAVSILSEDGLLAYVTCSPHIAETRLQVADFLYRHKGFELVDLNNYSKQLPAESIQNDGTIQLWTDLHDADSMFMAVFRRKSQAAH
jgi:16S rRNA (cytosine967-C5)-methyltransferase